MASGVFEQARGAGAGVPVVALHVAVGVLRDGRGGEAAVAAAVLAGEAAGVDHDAVGGGGVEVCAAGVLDAGIEGHGGGLAAAGDLDALGGGHAGRRRRSRGAEVGGVVLSRRLTRSGRPAKGSAAGDFGELDGAGDEALDAVGREVGGGGAGGALTAVAAKKTRRPRAREPDSVSCLDLAEADVDGELFALEADGFGVGGARAKARATTSSASERTAGASRLGACISRSIADIVLTSAAAYWTGRLETRGRPGRRWQRGAARRRSNARSRS